MTNTVETIDRSVYDGFTHFGVEHIVWIVLLLAATVTIAIIYRKGCSCDCRNACPRKVSGLETGHGHRYRQGQKICRHGMRMVLAMLMLADEIFKYALVAANHVTVENYLPFQLCSISIILAIVHAFTHKGSLINRYLGNFLYIAGLPGGIAAVLFPSWIALPAFSLMSIHSFTAHIMLIVYVVMTLAGGDIKPEIKTIPVSVAALLAMVAGIYAFDIAAGRNFMYLVHISLGSPLAVFEVLGDYRTGYAVMLAALIIVLYGPTFIKRKE